MILMHVAYGLDLIALTMGTALLIWSIKNPGKGSWLGKLFGVLVMALSIVSMVCMASCALQGAECHKSPFGGPGMMDQQQPSGDMGDRGMNAPKKMDRRR